MKKLLGKIVLFSVPFLLLLLMEMCLPIDFFTFRAWEALIVGGRNTRYISFFNLFLPGPFYPDMKLSKIEEGDLGHHTVYAVKKRVKWETDTYGYRKRPNSGKPSRVVIIGDSNIVGSGLTQEATLSEILGSRLGVDVYPLAPADMNIFLRDKRFTGGSTNVVILAALESTIVNLPLIITEEKNYGPFLENNLIRGVVIFLNRICKMNMYRFMRAKRDQTPKHVYGGMLFVRGDDANKEITNDEYEKTVHTIAHYNKIVTSRNVRFIFLPIPNKENIHYDVLPLKKKSIFLKSLIADLQQNEIEVIDTQSAFEEAKNKGVSLYFSDDTHWNEEGVNLTANLIARRVGPFLENQVPR
jgi:alginate O-acetyltransferase complex protein AlgJ